MSPRQWFLQDAATGQIRFTPNGIATLGPKFAKAGYDIRQIRTLAAFEAAVDASFATQMRALAATDRGKDPELDRLLDGLPGWE